MYAASQCYNIGTIAHSESATSGYFGRTLSGGSCLEYVAASAEAVMPSNSASYGISHVSFKEITSALYGTDLERFQSTKSATGSDGGNAVAAVYGSSSISLQNYVQQMFQPQVEYSFQPDLFLKPGKGTKFVGKAEEIKEFVEEAFETIFKMNFPEDIKMSVLDEKQFRIIAPSPGTIGLSLNRSQFGLLSEVFVLNDSLGRVMLTMGHELGHVLTATKKDPVLEEAKAYAFSFAWMDVIKEHNIAGLGNVFVNELPAANGLHDVAYAFVVKELKKGKKAWDVYKDILQKKSI